MHESLDPRLAAALARPLPPPPVPIFDIHMHSGSPQATAAYVKAANTYGVVRAVNMTFGGMADPLAAHFGDFFMPCGWPVWQHHPHELPDWLWFTCEWVDGLQEKIRTGMRWIKTKLVPHPDGPTHIWLDDPHLAPMFARCEELRLPVQVHAAHPTRWWQTGKLRAAVCGPKTAYLEQVERLMQQHPRLKVLSVHMGSSPEDLGYLGRLMDSYPNYSIDTSATKWTIRELSARPEQARAFFIRYADRISFGSDLVVRDDVPASYYTSRFHVQRTMWETSFRGLSMIRDPDAGAEGPYLNGLGLPGEALAKLYRGNAERMIAEVRVA
jgi:hypothetical protein